MNPYVWHTHLLLLFLEKNGWRSRFLQRLNQTPVFYGAATTCGSVASWPRIPIVTKNLTNQLIKKRRTMNMMSTSDKGKDTFIAKKGGKAVPEHPVWQLQVSTTGLAGPWTDCTTANGNLPQIVDGAIVPLPPPAFATAGYFPLYRMVFTVGSTDNVPRPG
jgi:hypothetical protein